MGDPPGELGVSKSMECENFSLQCFDTVGWATGRASSLLKVGCWFVGGDDLTGALHDL